MQEWYASIRKFSFRPTTAKQPKISCTPCYTCSCVPSVKSLSCNTPKAILQHMSATTQPGVGTITKSPGVFPLQQQEWTCIMCPLPEPDSHCITYHNVLWIQVITEGTIIKVDLVESLLCKADHFTLIEATILVLADDYLSRWQILECSLSSLRKERNHFLHNDSIKNVLRTIAPVQTRKQNILVQVSNSTQDTISSIFRRVLSLEFQMLKVSSVRCCCP